MFFLSINYLITITNLASLINLVMFLNWSWSKSVTQKGNELYVANTCKEMNYEDIPKNGVLRHGELLIIQNWVFEYF
jgi:hypothetical protein